MFTLENKRIWVAGHTGMVGSAVVRRLQKEACEIVTVPRGQADLTRQSEVEAFVDGARPDAIVLAAAKVGGILANLTYPAEFLYRNLMIEANVIQAAYNAGVAKFLLLGSSCIYPREAAQPIREDALLTGPLEPTSEPYAVAKIAGIKLAQSYRRQYGCDFISAMPSNLYGPGDNFDLTSSHVLPALMRKAHEAKLRGDDELVIWGTGKPRREFLHVDDCADALVLLLRTYSEAEHVNVGTGQDISIRALAELVCRVAGYRGRIAHDLSKPDGSPAKTMSADKLRAIGWRPSVSLEEGIRATYAWFLEHNAGRE